MGARSQSPSTQGLTLSLHLGVYIGCDAGFLLHFALKYPR